jgi:hypothetical protein
VQSTITLKYLNTKSLRFFGLKIHQPVFIKIPLFSCFCIELFGYYWKVIQTEESFHSYRSYCNDFRFMYFYKQFFSDPQI